MPTRQTRDGPPFESHGIGPGDRRYLEVVDKRFNKRFRASPDYVRLIGSTDQMAAAVQEAVNEGRRLVVTSGGHCLEGFVSDPAVQVIVDVSPIRRKDQYRRGEIENAVKVVRLASIHVSARQSDRRASPGAPE